jgi:hypothetical protein
MRRLAVIVTLGAALPAAAAPRFVCPEVITVSAVWFDSGALGVHVAVIHRDGGKPSHDGATYTLDDTLAERLEEDFGPFAPLVLRRIEARVQELSGPYRDATVSQEVLHCLQTIHRHLPYRVRSHVGLHQNTELWVHRLARELRRRMGHTMIITSGNRSPEKQAAAMYGKLARGSRYRRLYKKRKLAEEIRQAYRAARRKGMRRQEIIQAMTRVIEEQMRRGCYVSAHLKQVAVDVRSYDMIRRVRRVFRRVTEQVDGVKLLIEKRPPHFHLEVPPTAVVTGCPRLEIQQPEESEECKDPEDR